TAKGLDANLGPYRVNNQHCYLNATYADNAYWGETCLYPGTYYILLSDVNPATGQPYNIEKVTPLVWIMEQTGDRCSDAVPLALTGAGTATASTNVDCHTIGSDFGEDGSNMGCLFGPGKYKSTWFRLQLNGADKVDLSFRLTESTDALASQIRYRVMYGDCSYMTAGPCNTDALTEFTLNCMKAEGNIYFVQVVTPEEAAGELSLTVQTIRTLDQNCRPLDPLQPVANFRYQTTCNSEEVAFINQSTLGASMKYEWSFGVPGKTSAQTNPRVTFPRTQVTQTFQVKLKVTNTSNNKSDEITIPVQVLPAFAVTAGANQTVCYGAAAIGLAGYSPAGGTWSGTGVTATGQFNPAAAGLGTHTLTYTATQEGCTAQATKTITVQPATPVHAGSALAVCASEPAFTLSGMSPAGGTWSGRGVTATGQFDASVAGAGTHTLTYTLVQNGCANLATRAVTVSPLPAAQAGTDQAVCVNGAAFQLAGFSPAGGTWSGKGVTATGQFNPAVAGAGAHVLTYSVTQNGCTAAVRRTITVNALPVVQAGAPLAVCASEPAFTLSGMSPAGGTWSGKGVTAAGQFNPAAAGEGTHALAYTVTADGCPAAATKTITVRALPAVRAGADQTVCLGSPVITFTGQSPAGGTWSGKGINAEGRFDAAVAGPGVHAVTYTVTSQGCSASARKVVTVSAPPGEPLLVAGGPTVFCGTGSVMLTVRADKEASYQWL
ncbi:MAG TPA: hypothetical protein VF646_13595, partial [Cytophagales bacterium]